jgi:hypothetical protein
MDGKWKRGLGIGCLIVALVVVAILGVGTWYAGRINEEYKEVRDSEKALLAATEKEEEFRPPVGGIPGPDRIEVFLKVREELAPWCRTMASASGQFADDRERQRAGGVKNLLRVVNTGSDLMPVYAGFWVARNEVLLNHGMGPGEYSYIFRLVYLTWLKPDRPALADSDYPNNDLNDALEPYREQLLAGHEPTIELVELIFQKDQE